MRTYHLTYLTVAGKTLILVPVRARFGRRAAAEQAAFVAAVRKHVRKAGLAGEVVPVWADGAGGMLALARRAVLPCLTRLTWDAVVRNLNVRLVVGVRAGELAEPAGRERAARNERIAAAAVAA